VTFNYHNHRDFRQGLGPISFGVRYKVFFGKDGSDGHVLIGGVRFRFTGELNSGGFRYSISEKSVAELAKAFTDERERQIRSEELTEIAESLARNCYNTRFGTKNGRFWVESENVLFRKAKNIEELLTMINNCNK